MISVRGLRHNKIVGSTAHREAILLLVPLHKWEVDNPQGVKAFAAETKNVSEVVTELANHFAELVVLLPPENAHKISLFGLAGFADSSQFFGGEELFH